MLVSLSCISDLSSNIKGRLFRLEGSIGEHVRGISSQSVAMIKYPNKKQIILLTV